MGTIRDSFIFYRSFYEGIKELPRDIQGEVLTAIMEYGLNGVTTENLKPVAKAIFALVKPQLDANNKRFENGKNGGRPKQDKTETKPNNNQTLTNRKPNDNDNDNDIKEKDTIVSKKKERESWKDNFDVYKNDLRNAFIEIKKNKEWINKQQEFYPNMDIIKSVEKACVNFWSTKDGWQHKKKAKTVNINWNTTFANSIAQTQNKVYKDAKSTQPIQPTKSYQKL